MEYELEPSDQRRRPPDTPASPPPDAYGTNPYASPPPDPWGAPRPVAPMRRPRTDADIQFRSSSVTTTPGRTNSSVMRIASGSSRRIRRATSR